MLEFDNKSTPLSPTDMIHITRENGRKLEHYQDILEQNSLPKLPQLPGASILEIGTGLGNAIPGLLALTENEGRVVSIDINRSTLEEAKHRLTAFYSQESLSESIIHDVGTTPPKANVGVSLLSDELPLPIPSGITLVLGDISEGLALPSESFDIAASIWVFYQILDKLRALHNVLTALRKPGCFYAVATGAVAFTDQAISRERINWLCERVWNTRSSRFAWLTGRRELIHWASINNLPLRVLSLPDAIKILYPNANIVLGTTPEGRPEGSFAAVISSQEDILIRYDTLALPLGSFVSTRSSSVIPIYYAPEVFREIERNSANNYES